MAGSASAAAPKTPTIHPDSYYDGLLQSADEALSRRDPKTADFWIARFLGVSSLDPKTSRGVRDLEPLLKKRRLSPKAFIAGSLDPEFLEWFVKSLYRRWGVPEERVRAKHRSFEIASEIDPSNQYFVTVVAYPEIQSWFVMENGAASRQAVLALGSTDDKPLVFFGKLFQGAPSIESRPMVLESSRRPLHYLWAPEFRDLDGDGKPEIWLRYNLAWGNGFSQVLAVYRIQGETSLELVQKFVGENEGVARRLPDSSVEVATGIGSRIGMARFDLDRHRVEAWKYRGGRFEKISEKEVPHIFKSSAWKAYTL